MFALLCLALAFLVLLHQYVVWGYWFEISDLHHETVFVGLTAFAVGLQFLEIKKVVEEK